MRKILSTALVLGLCTSLLGCPPPADKKTDGSKPADTGTAETPADKPADGGETPATKPADGGETMTKPAKADAGVDLSHVKVGQKYHYKMNQGGSEMTMVYEVKAISEKEITHAVTMIMNGNPLGPASEQAWPLPAKPEGGTPAEAPADAPKAETERKEMEVAGKSWDVQISKSGETTSWMAMSPGSEWAWTYPGALKTMTGDTVTMELIKIEQP